MRSNIAVQGFAHGLMFEVVETPMGHRCGYVRVGRLHPLYKADYCDYDNYPDLAVHGGVTFASPRKNMQGVTGWWIGFDCGHSFDKPDMALVSEDFKSYAELGIFSDSVVRTESYVINECRDLARQLKEYASLANRAKRLKVKVEKWIVKKFAKYEKFEDGF